MARQTAAQRRAAEAAAAEQAEKEKAAYAATLPLKLLTLLARAQSRDDVDASVYASSEGLLRVEFKFQPADGQAHGLESTLYLDSESWQIMAIEDAFDALDAADRERARLRKIGQEAYDAMSEDARIALGVRRPR